MSPPRRAGGVTLYGPGGGSGADIWAERFFELSLAVDALKAGAGVLTVVKAVARAPVAIGGLPVIDGYQTIDADVVLLTAQASASQNGLWVTFASGWERPRDFADDDVITSRTVVANAGTTTSGTIWALDATPPVVVGTSPQIWVNTPVAGLTAALAALQAADALRIPLAQKGAANGVATLGADSKIPGAQLPALAIGETFPVASQAAMLALTAQRGDVAVRTDLTPDGFFLLTSDSPSTLADWVQITAPGGVFSVDGLTGVVDLSVTYGQKAADEEITGAWDFTTAPTVNGEPIAASVTTPTVLENAAGTAGLNVQHGLFWPTGIDLGHFLVEAWVCFLGAQSGYWLAEGYGGSHAILAGWNGDLTAGNIFDGSTNISWSGNYHWQVGEWGRVSVGWDGAYIWVYVNGIPCGRTPFAGPRRAGQGWFDTGGSDHSNMKARLAQIRVFEGANPMEGGGKAPSYVMPTARHFSKAWISGDGVSESAFAQALYDFTTLDTIIPDQGEGFGGRLHPGVMSNPPLARVSDPTAPFGNNTGAPRTRVPQAPLAVPAGWKIYDSVGRADSIPEFTAAPVPGSTEGGTLGAKAYLGTDTWGVFNGGLVCLVPGGAGGRWVANDSPNFDVRWRREIAFDAIGDIAGQFRVNTAGTTGFRIFTLGADLRMYRPDGSQLAMVGVGTTWTWLRVVTAGTSITIYVDDGAGGWTQVGTDTSSLNQTETRVGPYSDGSHGNAGRVEEWGVAA